VFLNQSDNNAFNDTTVSSLNASDEACGIDLHGSDNNTFSSSTTVTAITAVREAYGIAFEGGSTNTFNGSTTVTTINASGMASGIAFGLSDSNTFTGSTTITNVTANSSWASGILLVAGALSNKISGGTTIRYVRSNTGSAYGIWLLDVGGLPPENNEFYNCDISDISSGAPTTSAGIRISGDSRIPEGNNLFDGGKISKGDGPPIDYGVSIATSNGNTVVGFEISDNGHGVWLSNADNTTIERNIIKNNVMVDTGVHVTAGSEHNEIHENCFYDNVLQAYDDGSGNNWDRNFWSPPPGVTGDYTIPGNARTKDNQPLCYCPMCGPQKLPALTPVGMLALLSALSAIAVVSIQLERRKRR
jgi:parallel beta-helix repeat protein